VVSPPQRGYRLGAECLGILPEVCGCARVQPLAALELADVQGPRPWVTPASTIEGQRLDQLLAHEPRSLLQQRPTAWALWGRATLMVISVLGLCAGVLMIPTPQGLSPVDLHPAIGDRTHPHPDSRV
jgi:hypothetical protein